MNILFDEKPGEIYDILSSLYLLKNYDYSIERMKEVGIEINKNYHNILKSIMSSKKIDSKKLNRYFNKDLNIAKIFTQVSMWENKTLDKYLNFINNLNGEEVRERILSSIFGQEISKETIKKISSNNESVLNYIKDKEIDSSVKWEIFCLLNDTRKYLTDFTDFIKDYSDIYRESQKVRNIEIQEFNVILEKNIKKSGLEFLKEITSNLFTYKDYDNVYVSSMLCDFLTVEVDKDTNSCYVAIGTEIEKYIEKYHGSSNLENNLNIFKNISDKTRFSIIKLLLEKNYYGQEIAKALNITTATVSYHMNYLAVSRLVNIEKKDHKAYYSLNKNILRNCIKFLNNEFKL